MSAELAFTGSAGTFLSWAGNAFLAAGSDACFAAVAAAGFALVSQPPRRALPYVALLAAVGHALRFLLMEGFGFGISIASLPAALTMGCGSVLLTRYLHMPAEFFAFPALLPMIPGMYAYKAILTLIQFMDATDAVVRTERLVTMFQNAFTAMFVMCALVIGTLIPLYTFGKESWLMRHLGRRGGKVDGPFPSGAK